MALAYLIVLITVNHTGSIATLRILYFPFSFLLIPFLLILRIITIGVPWEQPTIFIHNHISIKLTATRYAQQNGKNGITNHASHIVPPHGHTHK